MDQIWMKNAYVVMIILANFGVFKEKHMKYKTVLQDRRVKGGVPLTV